MKENDIGILDEKILLHVSNRGLQLHTLEDRGVDYTLSSETKKLQLQQKDELLVSCSRIYKLKTYSLSCQTTTAILSDKHNLLDLKIRRKLSYMGSK